MKLARFPFLAALAALALLLAAAPARAVPALFDLTGDWRGVGVIREAPDKPAREGRCRISAIPLDPGREVRLKGRCASQAGSAALSMRFVLGEDGTIAGGVASSLRDGTVQFSGRLDGAVALLQSRAPVIVGADAGIVHIKLTVVDAAHFSLRQWFVPEDGSEPEVLVDMQFQR